MELNEGHACNNSYVYMHTLFKNTQSQADVCFPFTNVKSAEVSDSESNLTYSL